MTHCSNLTQWPDEASHAQHEGEDSEQSVQDAIEQVNGRPVSGPIQVHSYFEFAAAKIISNCISSSSNCISSSCNNCIGLPAGTSVEDVNPIINTTIVLCFSISLKVSGKRVLTKPEATECESDCAWADSADECECANALDRVASGLFNKGL